MGVDAKILLKLRGANRLPDRAELPEAVRMASVLDAMRFFIHFDNETRTLKDHHVLSIVRAEDNKWGDAESEHIGKVVWYQDGDPIIAEADEQFVEVHLWTRYYGPGYERGDWPTLRTVFAYLQRRWPNGEVWYGGDSSGYVAQLVTPELLATFDDLFFETGHRNYASHFKSFRGTRAIICPLCRVATNNSGGGGTIDYWYCAGCDGQYVTDTKSARITIVQPREDLFAAGRRHEELVAVPS